MKLVTEISSGGSIILDSSFLDLSKPGSRNLIVFYLYILTGVPEHSKSIIDVLSKQANSGWQSMKMLNFSDWFQASSILQLSVYIHDSTYELFLNGNHIGVPQGYGNKNVAHVQYEVSKEPFALLPELRITTHTT
ncbi:hypothetical protein EYZ11_000932 [Aspergillus tanneri]|uniref:Galectin domain-containing protein n=1 Tax=Aspergillus tanneri TaxID=1220188 RepID=A0A4S3JVY7_9EURO|nr:hypothetical protein EYZ11_000932 [Aspergillus tanneri]